MNDIVKTGSPELAQVLEKLPEQDRQVVAREIGVLMSAKSYNSPLPAPEDLREYENIEKGAANRIITLLEKQVEHRISQENKLVDNDHQQNKRGQWFGFILCVFFGCIAAWLAVSGHDWLAGSIVTVLIIAISIIFVLNQYPSFLDKNAKE